ncbi:FMN-binding negative transcriptional regulator [Emcibacter sp.]|uniref:FMN-binding negative transcriptional regulator n=1 Tax=Emcibacter sp. TaxID=1979954 RepID=UPI003A95D2C3
MYAPEPFNFTDVDTAVLLIDEIVMGTLLVGGDKIEGSPVPFMARVDSDGTLCLVGHMDRANPLWQRMEDHGQVIVIFWGPNSYISPSYYTSKPRVPTWAYATVHVTGRPQLIEDANGVDKIVSDLSRFLEQEGSAWHISQVEEYKEKLLKAIVGFEIKASDFQSQVRLLQTNTDADRKAVFSSLIQGSPAERHVANMMIKMKMAVGNQ